MNNKIYKKRGDGFTFIEVTITVIVLGVLAVIAIPSFKKHVERMRLTEAQVVLSAMKMAVQEYRLRNNGQGFGDLEGDGPCGNAFFETVGLNFEVSSQDNFQYCLTSLPALYSNFTMAASVNNYRFVARSPADVASYSAPSLSLNMNEQGDVVYKYTGSTVGIRP